MALTTHGIHPPIIMFKLYTLFHENEIPPLTLERYMRLLPPERKAKAQRFRKAIDRTNCVLGYLLLQYGLYQNYGIYNPIITYQTFGKPYLYDYPDIHFNISHCSRGCICAISDVPVGIDIQEIRPFSCSIAEHCCTKAELERLELSEAPDAEFSKIWTMKESYLKMKGTGIIYDLRAIDTTKLQDKISVFQQQGCYIAFTSAERFL